jgi:deazaflavin-dependent oxidoreductase (nitroreductase family)
LTLPNAVLPLMEMYRSPPGWRFDAKLVKFTGHSPYAYLYGLELGPRLFRRAVPYRPPLALTTIGRRSGRFHTVGLAYYEVEDTLAVVGSAGGSPKEPAWVGNVRANSAAWVHLHRKQIPVQAEVYDGEAKRPIWEKITEKAPLFAKFQSGVERDIPIVVLRRRDGLGMRS